MPSRCRDYKPGVKVGRCWVVVGEAERRQFPYIRNGRGLIQYEIECTNCGWHRKAVSSDLAGVIRCDRICRNCMLKPKGQSGLLYLFNNYTNGAKSRGLEFTLDVPTFTALTSGDCHYCGLAPSLVTRSTTTGKYSARSDWAEYRYNGIDRVINDIGYIASNCVPCCFACNQAKSANSVSDWKAHIVRLIDHNTPVRCPSWNERRETTVAEYQPTERQLLSV